MSSSTLINRLEGAPETREALRRFIRSTRLSLYLADGHGRILWPKAKETSRPVLCRLLHGQSREGRLCRTARRKALREAVRWGEASIGACCHALMQIVAPVMDSGKVAGALVASPFLMAEPTEIQVEEVGVFSRFPGKRKACLKALAQLPVLGSDETREASRALFQLAGDLSRPNLDCLLRMREIQELQGKIADEIQDLKTAGRDSDPYALTKLSYEEEREIVARIRLGDREGAKEILYRLLAITLSQYLENFDLLKISLLELPIVLSRAAVEAGAKVEEILGIRYRFITELAGIRDQETLCLWVVRMVEKLVDSLSQNGPVQNQGRLRKALDFVEANYAERLTVERIAREVFLSPSRLSHLIKKEMGVTLGDYICRVKVERAKGLLRNPEKPISEIALDVGFSDQSYFTKVFRKVEKCTPRAFREKILQPLVR
jgi:two-component system response regulator YesN